MRNLQLDPAVVRGRQTGNLSHRPHLHRPLASHGNPCSDRNGLVRMFGLDEEIAADLFFSFDERPVGGRGLGAGRALTNDQRPAAFSTAPLARRLASPVSSNGSS